MPQGVGYGLDAILAALAQGGQPIGQMGKVPTGINPSGPSVSQGVLPTEPFAQPNPTRAALGPTGQGNLIAILEALLAERSGEGIG